MHLVFGRSSEKHGFILRTVVPLLHSSLHRSRGIVASRHLQICKVPLSIKIELYLQTTISAGSKTLCQNQMRTVGHGLQNLNLLQRIGTIPACQSGSIIYFQISHKFH